MTIDGVIENYLHTPVRKVTTTGAVSLPEVGRVVPAAAGYPLHPRFDRQGLGPRREAGSSSSICSLKRATCAAS